MNEAGVQKSVSKIIELAGAGSAIAFKVDVSKEEQIKALVEKAVNTFGKFLISPKKKKVACNKLNAHLRKTGHYV